MKCLMLITISAFLILSCGKKGDGSSTRAGDTPLPPASLEVPVSGPHSEPLPEITDPIQATTPTFDWSSSGLRLEEKSLLQNQPPAIICINNDLTNSQKRKKLEWYLTDLSLYEHGINLPLEELSHLLEEAILSLSTEHDSKLCPKIFLAIGT